MTVRERFHSGTPTLSYELFPPRSAEAEETLWMTYERLATTDPDFFSVTYGAAGSTRDRSLGVVETLLESSPVPVVAHVTLVGASRAELANVIEKYLDKGARDFLALRGDPPEGQETWSPHPEGLQYASELVSLIRDVARGYGADDVSVGVTAFPTQHADSRQRMGALDVLRAKQEAGADFAITQVFHEHDQYVRLVHDAQDAGIGIPIIPEIVPVVSAERADRLAALTGVPTPEPLAKALYGASTADEARMHGVSFCGGLARTLLDEGAPGVHVITFNRHEAALELVTQLGLA